MTLTAHTSPVTSAAARPVAVPVEPPTGWRHFRPGIRGLPAVAQPGDEEAGDHVVAINADEAAARATEGVIENDEDDRDVQGIPEDVGGDDCRAEHRDRSGKYPADAPSVEPPEREVARRAPLPRTTATVMGVFSALVFTQNWHLIHQGTDSLQATRPSQHRSTRGLSVEGQFSAERFMNWAWTPASEEASPDLVGEG